MPTWYPGRPYRPADAEDVDKTEIPKSREYKSKLDEWLTGNVVEPMSKAGYPNVGAGVAAVPSTIAEFLTPESPYELAPGMAGVGKTTRKMNKKINDIVKKLKEINPTEYKNITNKFKRVSGSVKIKNDDLIDAFSRSDAGLKQLKDSKEKWQIDEIKNKYLDKILDESYPIKSHLFEDNQDFIMKDYDPRKEKYIQNKKIDKKGWEDLKKRQAIDVDRIHRSLFGKPTKPYLRPKGYANQKKQVKPTAPATKQMSREEYDKMLQGRTDPNYYDKLRESFNNTEQELSPLERFLKERE